MRPGVVRRITQGLAELLARDGGYAKLVMQQGFGETAAG